MIAWEVARAGQILRQFACQVLGLPDRPTTVSVRNAYAARIREHCQGQISDDLMLLAEDALQILLDLPGFDRRRRDVVRYPNLERKLRSILNDASRDFWIEEIEPPIRSPEGEDLFAWLTGTPEEAEVTARFADNKAANDPARRSGQLPLPYAQDPPEA